MADNDSPPPNLQIADDGEDDGYPNTPPVLERQDYYMENDDHEPEPVVAQSPPKPIPNRWYRFRSEFYLPEQLQRINPGMHMDHSQAFLLDVICILCQRVCNETYAAGCLANHRFCRDCIVGRYSIVQWCPRCGGKMTSEPQPDPTFDRIIEMLRYDLSVVNYVNLDPDADTQDLTDSDSDDLFEESSRSPSPVVQKDPDVGKTDGDLRVEFERNREKLIRRKQKRKQRRAEAEARGVIFQNNYGRVIKNDHAPPYSYIEEHRIMEDPNYKPRRMYRPDPEAKDKKVVWENWMVNESPRHFTIVDERFIPRNLKKPLQNMVYKTFWFNQDIIWPENVPPPAFLGLTPAKLRDIKLANQARKKIWKDQYLSKREKKVLIHIFLTNDLEEPYELDQFASSSDDDLPPPRFTDKTFEYPPEYRKPRNDWRKLFDNKGRRLPVKPKEEDKNKESKEAKDKNKESKGAKDKNKDSKETKNKERGKDKSKEKAKEAKAKTKGSGKKKKTKEAMLRHKMKVLHRLKGKRKSLISAKNRKHVQECWKNWGEPTLLIREASTKSSISFEELSRVYLGVPNDAQIGHLQNYIIEKIAVLKNLAVDCVVARFTIEFYECIASAKGKHLEVIKVNQVIKKRPIIPGKRPAVKPIKAAKPKGKRPIISAKYPPMNPDEIAKVVAQNVIDIKRNTPTVPMKELTVRDIALKNLETQNVLSQALLPSTSGQGSGDSSSSAPATRLLFGKGGYMPRPSYKPRTRPVHGDTPIRPSPKPSAIATLVNQIQSETGNNEAGEGSALVPVDGSNSKNTSPHLLSFSIVTPSDDSNQEPSAKRVRTTSSSGSAMLPFTVLTETLGIKSRNRKPISAILNKTGQPPVSVPPTIGLPIGIAKSGGQQLALPSNQPAQPGPSGTPGPTVREVAKAKIYQDQRSRNFQQQMVEAAKNCKTQPIALKHLAPGPSHQNNAPGPSTSTAKVPLAELLRRPIDPKHRMSAIRSTPLPIVSPKMVSPPGIFRPNPNGDSNIMLVQCVNPQTKEVQYMQVMNDGKIFPIQNGVFAVTSPNNNSPTVAPLPRLQNYANDADRPPVLTAITTPGPSSSAGPPVLTAIGTTPPRRPSPNDGPPVLTPANYASPGPGTPGPSTSKNTPPVLTPVKFTSSGPSISRASALSTSRTTPLQFTTPGPSTSKAMLSPMTFTVPGPSTSKASSSMTSTFIVPGPSTSRQSAPGPSTSSVSRQIKRAAPGPKRVMKPPVAPPTQAQPQQRGVGTGQKLKQNQEAFFLKHPLVPLNPDTYIKELRDAKKLRKGTRLALFFSIAETKEDEDLSFPPPIQCPPTLKEVKQIRKENGEESKKDKHNKKQEPLRRSGRARRAYDPKGKF